MALAGCCDQTTVTPMMSRQPAKIANDLGMKRGPQDDGLDVMVEE